MRSWEVAHPCTWQAHAEPAGCNPSSWTFPLDVLGGPKRKSLTGLSSCSRPLLHSPSPLRWFLGPEGTHTTRPTHLRRGVPWSPCCLKHLLLWATVEGDQSYGKRQITSSPPPSPAPLQLRLRGNCWTNSLSLLHSAHRYPSHPQRTAGLRPHIPTQTCPSSGHHAHCPAFLLPMDSAQLALPQVPEWNLEPVCVGTWRFLVGRRVLGQQMGEQARASLDEVI